MYFTTRAERPTPSARDRGAGAAARARRAVAAAPPTRQTGEDHATGRGSNPRINAGAPRANRYLRIRSPPSSPHAPAGVGGQWNQASRYCRGGEKAVGVATTRGAIDKRITVRMVRPLTPLSAGQGQDALEDRARGRARARVTIDQLDASARSRNAVAADQEPCLTLERARDPGGAGRSRGRARGSGTSALVFGAGQEQVGRRACGRVLDRADPAIQAGRFTVRRGTVALTARFDGSRAAATGSRRGTATRKFRLSSFCVRAPVPPGRTERGGHDHVPGFLASSSISRAGARHPVRTTSVVAIASPGVATRHDVFEQSASPFLGDQVM